MKRKFIKLKKWPKFTLFQVKLWRHPYSRDIVANNFPIDAAIFLKSGRDKYWKGLWISYCYLLDLKKKALLRLLALTVCDQVSSFLRKKSVTSSKILDKNSHLLQEFIKLGSERKPSDKPLQNIENLRVSCMVKNDFGKLVRWDGISFTLREKCPNTEFLLLCILLHSVWIKRFPR